MAYSTSRVELYGVKYYVILVKNKFEHKLLFYTDRHKDDLGKELSEVKYQIFNPNDKDMLRDTNYLAEYVEFRNGVPKRSYNGSLFLAQIFMEELNEAKSYGYLDSEIIMDEIRKVEGNLSKTIYKISQNYKYEEDFTAINFKTPKMEVNFTFVNKNFTYPKVELKKIEEDALIKKVKNLNFNEFKFDHIKNLYDIRWLEEKDYDYIDNDEDFHKKAICPMVWEILDAKERGEKALIGFDTEDTGLDFYYDKDGNFVDRLTTVQLSWKDHQGVIAYVGMDSLNNCSIDGVLRPLSQIFRWRLNPKEVICRIELKYDRDGNKLDIPYQASFYRDCFLVGGHNHIFDGRVVRKYDYEMFFDIDTLTITNLLTPNRIPFSRGLKSISKRLLGVEMLELTGIFGKGNEGMFHVLTDHEMTKAYGCADTDFFRLCYKKLVNMMNPKMYKSYHGVGAYIDNMISRSEYYGIRANKENINATYHRIEKDLEILRNLAYKHVGMFIDISEANKSGKKLSLQDIANSRYEFKLKGDEARHVIYNIMNYPAEVMTPKGIPAVNTVAFKKMMSYENESPVSWLSEDLISSDGETVLINKDEFNKYKFPLSYLFTVYSDLLKDMDNYYRPFYKNRGERIYKQIKPVGTFTNRIGTPLQTVKKHIKKELIPHEDGWHCVNWDEAQIEARAFNSFGGDQSIIRRFMNPEADTHVEVASDMYQILAHLVTSKIRSGVKSVAFGIPYGLQDRKLCERIYGKVTTDNLLKTRELRLRFETRFHGAMEFLNNARNKAYEEAYMSQEWLDFVGLTKEDMIVAVYDDAGFFRYKHVKEYQHDSGRRASDARAFGNFPIQSYCAYLYKTNLVRMDMRLRRDGKIDLFIPHVYVHDEIHCSYHESLSIAYLIKVFREECVLRVKGHTNYFIGVSFGENWLDCKSGKNEIPMVLLDRIAKGQVDLGDDTNVKDPAKFLEPVITKFKLDRVEEVVKSILKVDDLNCTIDAEYLFNNFTNYCVRGYLSRKNVDLYHPRLVTVENEEKGEYEQVEDNNDISLSYLVSILEERGYDFKIKDFESDEILTPSELRELRNKDKQGVYETVIDDIDLDLDLELEEEEDFLDLDTMDTSSSDRDLYDYYYSKYLIKDDHMEKIIDKMIEDYKQEDDKCEHISKLNNFIIITVDSYAEQKRITAQLSKYRTTKSNGKGVMIRLDGSQETLPFKYELPGIKTLENILFRVQTNNVFGGAV